MPDLNTLKLTPPSSALPLQARVTLLDRLAARQAFRLVLLRAPAGYGKTSLLRLLHAHATQTGARCAWLTLDSADNDPARLLLGLRMALKLPAAATHDDPLRLAGTPVTHLFLDDLERLAQPAIALLFSLIGSMLPAQLNIYLAARSLHQHSVAGLKAKGVLLELDMQDLQFTAAETRSYLQHAGLDIPAAQLAQLQAACEGWPAAVELIALAWRRLRGRGSSALPDLRRLGDLADYLSNEVYEAQPDELKRFLAATAPLPSFCPELADAVRQRSDSAQLIAATRAAGLPIQPLPDNWFRYHPLFAEHIAQLHRPPPAVHALAARWLVRHDYSFESIDYFLKAGEPEQAAATLGGILDPLRRRAQFFTIINWCEQLPPEVLQRRPPLCSALLAGLIYTARRQDLAPWLAYFRSQAADPHAAPQYRATLNVFDPVLAYLDGDAPRCMALARQHCPAPPDTNPYERLTLACMAAHASLWRGAYAETAALLIEARRAGGAAGSLHSGAMIGCVQICLDAIHGQFSAALVQMAAIDELARLHEGELAPAFLYPFSIGLMQLIDYERNALDAVRARQGLVQGLLALGLPWDAFTAVLIVQARMQALDQGLAAARRWLEHEIVRWHQRLVPPARAALEGELARMAVVAGDARAVAAYAALLGPAEPVHCIVTSQEIDGAGIAEARLMLHAGPPAPAIARLRQLLDHALESGRCWRATKLRALLAVGLQGAGAARDADQQLCLALEQAASAGMLRLFLDEGQAVLTLLRQLQAKSRHLLSTPAAQHLGRILLIADAAPAPALPPAGLTPTECALLSQVALGRSNREIGDSLCLSVNTVKWHMSQIFRKLNASNRSQAVFNARQAGLLP